MSDRNCYYMLYVPSKYNSRKRMATAASYASLKLRKESLRREYMFFLMTP